MGSLVRRKFCIRSGILAGLKNYPAPEPVSPDFTAIVDLLMCVNATGLYEVFTNIIPMYACWKSASTKAGGTTLNTRYLKCASNAERYLFSISIPMNGSLPRTCWNA